MPFIRVNGVNLYYEQQGEGYPLVLIAGYSCRTNHWDAVKEEFARQASILVFDNRGVGQSDAPEFPYSIEMMALDTLALMDHLNIERADMLGHSMGGCIAQWIAVNRPERMRKLILANSLIKMNAVSVMAQKGFLHLRESGTAPERIVEMLLPWLFSSEFLSDSKLVDTITGLILSNPYPQTIPGIRGQLAALAGFDSSGWCRQIRKPALVIGGSEDILCPRDSAALAHAIKGAHFVDMPRMGHVPMVEKPAAFSHEVIRFLNSP